MVTRRGRRSCRAVVRSVGQLLLAVAGASAAPAGAAATEPASGRWQLSAASEHHLDAASLDALADDEVWLRMKSRPGTNLGYLLDEVRLSRSSGPWTLTLLARQRATAVANDQALDLGRVAEVSGAPATDRQWGVRLKALGFAGVGAELTRQLDLVDLAGMAPGWQAQWGVQGLALTRLFERSLQGTAAYEAATGAYRADLRSYEADDHLTFPFQQSQAARGSALLLHAALGWQDAQRSLRFSLRDAGWLQWRGLPQQDATVATHTSAVDRDGFVLVGPLVQGQNSQARYRRWLTPISEIEAAWRGPSTGRWSVGALWLPGWGALPRADWRQQWGDWGLGLGWRVHEQRAEVGLSHGGWQLRAGADRRHQAGSLAWSLSWQSGAASN